MTGAALELEHFIRAERPRLVLLDLMLPGCDGIELICELRRRFDLPVIFISGYGRDETVARALESGAADYLVKPFSPTELVARVRATLRRHEQPEPFTLGALAIDYERRRVTVDGNAMNFPRPKSHCCVCSRSTPHGSWPSTRCLTGRGRGVTPPM